MSSSILLVAKGLLDLLSNAPEDPVLLVVSAVVPGSQSSTSDNEQAGDGDEGDADWRQTTGPLAADEVEPEQLSENL